MAIECRLCGVKGHEARGVVLQRVNERGVEGIWECRPICGAQMPSDDAVVAAVDGVFEAKTPAINSLFYTARQLRDSIVYNYLDQEPEPSLLNFLDWLVRQERN